MKRFDDVVAVDGILASRSPHGSFFALLGPSGCGKTTTLRMIGGFEEPDGGRIELGGSDVVGLPPYKRDVNTVFQSYALFPHLTVEENVAFGLRRKGLKGRELRRAEEAMLLVDVAPLGKRKPRQLSGGQQQRVALARALVNSPRVLLLDEPLGALDLKLRKQLQLELKRIQHEVGITFVHVTHDQEEAMTMADTIAVMNLGHVEQLGAPAELYERPATPFVAGFLGASNLLAGELERRPGRARRRHGDRGQLERPQRRASRPGCGPRRCGSARAAARTGSRARSWRPPTSGSPRRSSSRRRPAPSRSGRRMPSRERLGPRRHAGHAHVEPRATFVVDRPEETHA